MSSSVDRTFVINFRVVPTKVKYSDISSFITTKLGFDLTQIKHLQVSNGRVFVGTDSPQLAQDVVQEHNLKHQVEYEGKLYTIPLSMEDGSVEVRIHDLRPRISNRQVAQRLAEYGEILSIRDEIWKDFFPGVPNGIRVLRMQLKKPIPSYVTVDSDMSLVTYKGQPATCKHCHRNVHYTQTCSEYAKSLNVSVNARLSMADALKGVRSVSTNQPDGNISSEASSSNGVNLSKNAPRHTSNISLTSEISISSAEQMETEYPLLPSVEPDVNAGEPLVDVVGANESKINKQPNITEPQVHGNSTQHSTQTKPQKQHANIKRPLSPLSANKKSAEKRQSRSQTRSERMETRTFSKSRQN